MINTCFRLIRTDILDKEKAPDPFLAGKSEHIVGSDKDFIGLEV